MLVALLAVPTAAGAWSAGGAGTGAAGAASMPAGERPTAIAVLTSVTVTWSASFIAGAPVGGYIIHRYATISGVESTPGGSCSGVVTATTCTESPGLGSWQYSVAPVTALWTGAEGLRSLPVVVTL